MKKLFMVLVVLGMLVGVVGAEAQWDYWYHHYGVPYLLWKLGGKRSAAGAELGTVVQAQSQNCYTYCCGTDGEGRCTAWCTRCY